MSYMKQKSNTMRNKQKKNIHGREYKEMIKKMRALSAFGGLRRKDNEKKQKKIYLNTSKINETSPPQKQILSNRLPTSYQNYQSISAILSLNVDYNISIYLCFNLLVLNT